MGLYVCELCDDEPFKAPVDEIGVVLMQAHLEDEHGVRNG